MNVRIDNHVISFASYQRFVLVQRIEGAGEEHMIGIFSRCLRRVEVTSSIQSFPTTLSFHPFCPQIISRQSTTDRPMGLFLQ